MPRPTANAAIKFNPKLPGAYFARANVDSFKQQYDEAIADLTKSFVWSRIRPARTTIAAWRTCAIKTNRNKAIDDYTEAIRLDPSQAQYFEYRANEYIRLKHHWEEAIADYNQTVRLEPSKPDRYETRGDAYYISSRLRARDCRFQRSDSVESHTWPTVSASAAGPIISKKKMATRFLISTRPSSSMRKNAATFDGRGRTYKALKNNQHALADFSEAVKLRPRTSPTAAIGPESTMRSKTTKRRMADCSESIRLQPKNAILYHYRANVHSANREFDAAIADYSESIRLNPNYPFAYEIAREYLSRTAASGTSHRPTTKSA